MDKRMSVRASVCVCMCVLTLDQLACRRSTDFYDDGCLRCSRASSEYVKEQMCINVCVSACILTQGVELGQVSVSYRADLRRQEALRFQRHTGILDRDHRTCPSWPKLLITHTHTQTQT